MDTPSKQDNESMVHVQADVNTVIGVECPHHEPQMYSTGTPHVCDGKDIATLSEEHAQGRHVDKRKFPPLHPLDLTELSSSGCYATIFNQTKTGIATGEDGVAKAVIVPNGYLSLSTSGGVYRALAVATNENSIGETLAVNDEHKSYAFGKRARVEAGNNFSRVAVSGPACLALLNTPTSKVMLKSTPITAETYIAIDANSKSLNVKMSESPSVWQSIKHWFERQKLQWKSSPGKAPEAVDCPSSQSFIKLHPGGP